MNTYTFLAASFIIILLPGTGVIYTISTGIAKGRKAGAWAALGCTAGILPHLCLSTLLSSLVLKMNPQILKAIKAAGVLYLLYLGAGMVLSKTSSITASTTTEENRLLLIRRGILINLLNPKLTLFFFSFLPQYASGRPDCYVSECLILGLLFMLLTFLVFCGYGILAGISRDFLEHSPQKLHRLQQVFGILFLLFAANLAVGSL